MTRSALLTVVLLAVLAAGCGTTLPAPTTVEDALATAGPAPESAGLAPASLEVDEAWWRAYGDENLDRLVETAVDNNLDLAQAALTIKKAWLQVGRLGYDRQPKLSAGLSASARKNLKDGGSVGQSYGGDFGLSYEVDLWRRLRDLQSAQEWELQATVADEAALRLTIVNAVIDAYHHLAYLNDALLATRESMARYEQIETLVRARFEAGKADRVEPVQARQSYLAENARLIEYQSELKVIDQTLRNLLNLKPFDLPPATPTSLVGFEPDAPDLEVPLTVLSNRPDLRAAEFRLRRAFKNADATVKSLYPTLSLNGSLSSSGDRIGRAFEVPFTGGAVAVAFPFLQWNTIRTNIRVSEVEYEQMRLAFEQAVTTALNEVDRRARDSASARELLANAKDKFAADTEVADYRAFRYEQGASELSDWLDALNTLSNSRLALLSNRYRVIQSDNLLYQSMAGRLRATPTP